MTKEDFVKTVRFLLKEQGKEELIDEIENPPGRFPKPEKKELAEWFVGLDETSKKYITKIIDMSIDNSLFGIFCILDGVRAIENENKGVLQLYYKNGDNEVLLNSVEGEELHDLYME